MAVGSLPVQYLCLCSEQVITKKQRTVGKGPGHPNISIWLQTSCHASMETDSSKK